MLLQDMSVRGRREKVPALRLGNTVVVIKGRLLKVAEVFDEYWLERRKLPEPAMLLDELRKAERKPDLFTFAQRVPDSEPQYGFPLRWDNLAVLPLSSYEAWFRQQISSTARRNIRAGENRGVVVRVSEFDDAYVRGIMSIYDESPIRQGRKFWHYEKDFLTVRAENGTYSDRSTFLAAYVGGNMIGYLKIVWDEPTAAIMQILSKIEFLDKRPNNALLAEAVRQCCARGITHLLYEKFRYGNKIKSSLMDFKRSNGFIGMDVPRYFVPLTLKGSWALGFGVGIRPREILPLRLRTYLMDLRARWYTRHTRQR